MNIAGTYDVRLVVLSFLVAVLASYTAIDLAGRVTVSRGSARTTWLTVGASAMGLGIWSMHLVAMHALRFPVPMPVNWPTTLLSLLVALAASGLALATVSRPALRWRRLLLGGLLMGLGISAMHFISVEGMRAHVEIRYNPGLVLLAILIAIVASLVALWMAFRLREGTGATWRLKSGAALVMGAAISGMHYTGMAAAAFRVTNRSAAPMSHAASASWEIDGAVVIGTVIALGLVRLTAFGDRRLTAQTMKRERDLLHLLMDSLPDQVFFKDAQSRFVRINRAGAEILGLRDPDEAIGKTDVDFASADQAAAYIADDRRVMESRAPLRDIMESIVGADGVVRWISTTKAPTFDADGKVTGVVGVSRDISERRGLEEQLAHQAFHDALTSLPNRMLFANRLEHALERSARSGAPLAVLFIDLDGFKVVNDRFGHDLGDLLLQTIAGRLQACARTGDTVARLGGDEFILLLEDADAGTALGAARRIAARLDAPLVLGGRLITVTASIGIACKSSPLDQAEELLKNADVAMYVAKRRGRAQCALYDRAMQDNAGARQELEDDLRVALARNEFCVLYQPLADLTTGRTTGVEALIRWNHPTRGLIAPGAFIPLAEETGVILPIGWWVMTEACRQARRWQDGNAHGPRLSISVNLSPRMFQQPDLVVEVARILAETGLPPASLMLEVTEGVMIEDGDAAIATLRRLRALGVHLAIDDFGTGYSSLTYLHRLPIDVLKIDRSFVARMGKDAESLEIVRLIIGLAQTMKLSVIGEGVETETQRVALRDLGANQGQGYLFAPPMTALDATAHLILAHRV